MSDTAQPILDSAVFRFSDAVYRVMKKRHDFEGYICPAFRELIAEHPRHDLFAEQSTLSATLETGGTNKPHHG